MKARSKDLILLEQKHDAEMKKKSEKRAKRREAQKASETLAATENTTMAEEEEEDTAPRSLKRRADDMVEPEEDEAEADAGFVFHPKSHLSLKEKTKSLLKNRRRNHNKIIREMKKTSAKKLDTPEFHAAAAKVTEQMKLQQDKKRKERQAKNERQAKRRRTVTDRKSHV
eukprot:TRINITY_DN809_c0_g1_i1.p1 TRINITY_DN809_c0_g1~~TRINITY_DN809_c0_g1_i1.p1  ORF type:complete len:177 (-),score=58.62 TRINITY_DN809_c0_g1_i1:122-631(-)